MTRVYTELSINASADTISKVLYQFQNYPKWNSFIKEIESELNDYSTDPQRLVGHDIEVVYTRFNGKKHAPIEVHVLYADKSKLQWEGHFYSNVVMKGVHTMEIEVVNDQKCIFKNYEDYSGVAAYGLEWTTFYDDKVHDYARMNMELKKVAEAGWARL